jgi:ADP-heptose:LPS heptosyltransferase
MDEPGLVVKTHAFGDAMLATPAVRELLKSEKGLSRWIALTGPSAEDVWRRFPGIDTVLVAPFPPRPGAGGRIGLLLWSLRARRALRGVSRAWVFHTSPRVRRWVRFLTGAGEVFSGGSESLGDWEEARGFDPCRFAGSSYAAIAGVTPGSWQPEFAPTSSETEEARGILGEGRWFAIAPGGGSNPRDTVVQKRWSTEGFREVAGRLRDRGLGLLLLGGPGDVEISGSLAAGLEAGAGRVIDMTGRTGWGLTTALIRECGLFLGNDTGTAHAAVAAGARAVVVFGPTDPDSLYSPGSVAAVRSGVPCAPCYANTVFPGCTRTGEPCMGSVGADDVWKAVEGILREDNRP